MQITEEYWKGYVKKLRKLSDTAANKMQKYIDIHGTEDRKGLIDYAYSLTNTYCNGTSTLSANLYDAIADLQGVRIPAAEIEEPLSYGEVAKTVNGTLKTGNEDNVSKAIGTLVKRAGADTTLKNALRDGAEFAWIPSGDTCAFCLTLASQGWQKASKAAIKNGHAEHIHANCDCTYAVRFKDNLSIKGYNPEEYKQMYDDAEGKSAKDKINYIRRQNYDQNREKILEQQREAYEARKERNEGEPDTKN